MRSERIVLTLPPDPALSRLTRMATQHFFRLHGVRLSEARRRSRSVETRVRAALRVARSAAPRSGARRRPSRQPGTPPRAALVAVALHLIARARTLEVLVRRSRGGAVRLMLIDRPGGES